MVSGFVNCGFGFGGFFFGILQTQFCNPGDLRPQLYETTQGKQVMLFGDEVASKVPDMLRDMTKIWFSLFLFGLFTISNYPSESFTD